MTERPRWAMAVLRMALSCFLSPLKDRATKVAPHFIASAQQSKGGRLLGVPDFKVEPKSAVGDGGLEDGIELFLVAAEGSGDKGGAPFHSQRAAIKGRQVVGSQIGRAHV